MAGCPAPAPRQRARPPPRCVSWSRASGGGVRGRGSTRPMGPSFREHRLRIGFRGMCGIAGFATAADDAAVAQSLLDSLDNRGPDGGWVEHVDDVTLVQTRLAVIDLSDR